MLIADATGRIPIRIFVAQPIKAYQQGIAWDGAAYLVDLGAPVATDSFVSGMRLTGIGCIRGIAAPVAALSYVGGWPKTSTGATSLYGTAGNVAVPAGTAMNGGVAMDANGVYANIIP